MTKMLLISDNKRFMDYFEQRGYKLVSSLKKADVVQLMGGPDICPSIYGHQSHPKTQPFPRRDIIECSIIRTALIRGIPVAGICRGGQLINALCGGQMYQHVSNHANGRTHKACYYGISGAPEDVDMVDVTSTHHQAMIVTKEADIFLEAWEAERKDYMSGNDILTYNNYEYHESDPNCGDVEGCWYREKSALCFQPHPEWAHNDLADMYDDVLSVILK